MSEWEKPIADLNDALRTTFKGGDVVMTQSVAQLEEAIKYKLMQAVQSFDEFTEDNDPYKEHDFWSVDLAWTQYFWKIDYYSKQDENRGSENPWDPEVTRRVMTILEASEY